MYDIQSQVQHLEEKEKDAVRQLDEERSRAEHLEVEAQRSFEAEEQAARYKDELDSLKQELLRSQAQVIVDDSSTNEAQQALRQRILDLEAAAVVKDAQLEQFKV